MEEVALEEGGCLPRPARCVQRHGLTPESRVWLSAMEEGLTVAIPRLAVRKVYLEVITRYHLPCAMCVRTS